MSYRYLVHDILETFKQEFDDKEFEFDHVLFWVQTVANRLTSQHVKKTNTGAFLSTYTAITVNKTTTSTAPDVVADRKYITLPSNVYDFNNDAAIEYISYELDTCTDNQPAWTQVFFQRTSPRKAYRLKYNAYEEPTPSNPYFYRVKNNIYLLGIECVQVATVEIGITASMDPTDVCDIDDEVRMPDELIPILRAEVLALGRFALQIPRERVNEGSDMTTQAITQKGVEVAQPPAPRTTEQQQTEQQ